MQALRVWVGVVLLARGGRVVGFRGDLFVIGNGTVRRLADCASWTVMGIVPDEQRTDAVADSNLIVRAFRRDGWDRLIR